MEAFNRVAFQSCPRQVQVTSGAACLGCPVSRAVGDSHLGKLIFVFAQSATALQPPTGTLPFTVFYAAAPRHSLEPHHLPATPLSKGSLPNATYNSITCIASYFLLEIIKAFHLDTSILEQNHAGHAHIA